LQVGGLLGVVEDQQPAVAPAQLVKQRLEGLSLLGRVGQAKPPGEGDQLPGNGERLLGRDPPDQVVVGLVAVGVLDGELGLADPAEPLHRLGLTPLGPGRPPPPSRP